MQHMGVSETGTGASPAKEPNGIKPDEQLPLLVSGVQKPCTRTRVWASRAASRPVGLRSKTGDFLMPVLRSSVMTPPSLSRASSATHLPCLWAAMTRTTHAAAMLMLAAYLLPTSPFVCFPPDFPLRAFFPRNGAFALHFSRILI